MNVHESALVQEDGVARLAGGEAEAFLRANPSVQYVDCVFVDLCGNVRGKRVPSEELPAVFQVGLQVPCSIYFLDARGDTVNDLIALDGATGTAWPVEGSLTPVTWGQRPHGQVLLTLRDSKGKPYFGEPRNVLRRVVSRFEEFDVSPALGLEIEGLFVMRERAKDGIPVAPGAGALRILDDILEDAAAAVAAQALPKTTITKIGAQIRIRPEGVLGAVEAADHAVFVRQIVRAVARRHGYDALFMAKPLLSVAGNGLCVTIDLRRNAGGSVFAQGPGGDLARFAVGGMQALAVEALALFAPNSNAFRRFGGAGAIAKNRRWGYGNASTNLSVESRGENDLIVAHRLASADANPYLVAAAVLAGVHYGIAKNIDPGAGTSDNACAFVDPTFPTNFESALVALENGSVVREYLGPEYVDLYCDTKRAELERFRAVIPAHEYDWYA